MPVGKPPSDRDHQNEPEDNFPPAEYSYAEDGKPKAGVGQGVGEAFVRAYFPVATREIRIATSYFSLRGYQLAFEQVGPKVQLRILVGKREAGHVVEAIASTLNRELGQSDVSLHDAVDRLVQKIERGEFVIRDAGELCQPPGRARFHCKFNLCDDQFVWSGSTNFSFFGLHERGNIEQAILSREPEIVALFIHRFEQYLSQSRDVLEEVRHCLRTWLDLSTPFEVYLKVLHYLYSLRAADEAPGGTLPTYFQEAIIERARQQVENYSGALLLVATGLGKTIIGAETARRLLSRLLGASVILLAPRVVREAWEKELHPRGVHAHFFDTQTVFRRVDDRQVQAQLLEERLEECTAQTVILVDEAHRYRKVLQKQVAIERHNRDLPEPEHQRNLLEERLAAAAGKGARIVLLTATPYGTTLQDLRGLLHLLPPTAEPGTPEENEGRWWVDEIADMPKRKVVTILSLVHVLRMARQRGDVEADGRLYIAMPKGRKQYWPSRLRLHRLQYELPFSDLFCKAFEEKSFTGPQVVVHFHDDTEDRARVGATISSENNALRAWMSSLPELHRVTKELLEKPDVEEAPEFDAAVAAPGASRAPAKRRTSPSLKQSERQSRLALLAARLAGLNSLEDSKFVRLTQVLEEQLAQGRKVLLFAERYTTAHYLATELEKHLGQAVGCTVRRGTQVDRCTLKSDRLRRQAVHCFAPEANRGRRRRKSETETNVLVCTDADGVGLNLQDADVIINYDLPMSADELYQRAGRILRMSARRDRVVDIYTFVPLAEPTESRAARAVQGIVSHLDHRQRRSTTLLGGCLLPPAEEAERPTEVPLATAEDIDRIPNWFNPPEDALQADPVAAVAHRSVYRQNEARAASLPHVLMSARTSSLPEAHVFVLLEVGKQLQAIRYQPTTGSVENLTEERALGLLSCDDSEPKARVPAGLVERVALQAMYAWHAVSGSTQEQIDTTIRLCTVYMEPVPKGRKAAPKVDGILAELTDPIQNKG
jgi:superfamily II DNA or RNA helicase